MKKLARETGSPTKNSCDSAKWKEKERQETERRAKNPSFDLENWEGGLGEGGQSKKREWEDREEQKKSSLTLSGHCSVGLAGEGQESTLLSLNYTFTSTSVASVCDQIFYVQLVIVV